MQGGGTLACWSIDSMPTDTEPAAGSEYHSHQQLFASCDCMMVIFPVPGPSTGRSEPCTRWYIWCLCLSFAAAADHPIIMLPLDSLSPAAVVVGHLAQHHPTGFYVVVASATAVSVERCISAEKRPKPELISTAAACMQYRRALLQQAQQ